MIGIVARLKIKPGEERAFEEAFTAMAEGVRANEPGNKLYDLFRLKDEPGTYIVQEQYVDEEALKAHRSAPHVKEWGPKVGACLAAAPVIEMLDRVG